MSLLRKYIDVINEMDQQLPEAGNVKSKQAWIRIPAGKAFPPTPNSDNPGFPSVVGIATEWNLIDWRSIDDEGLTAIAECLRPFGLKLYVIDDDGDHWWITIDK